MSEAAITRVIGRELLDSRGAPTVEADVVLDDGTVGRAMVPSGASTGQHEAVELRDGDSGRYRGRGVRTAVRNLEEIIGPALVGLNPGDQDKLDRLMIAVDGTANKARLGANAILAVSIAACRAAAQSRGVALYRHIADLTGTSEPIIPLPMVNILSGGLHASSDLDIQDVLVVPLGAPTYPIALQQASEVFAVLGDRIRTEGLPPLMGDEGGWAPALPGNEDAIIWVAEAVQSAGLDAVLALDVAATHFYDPITQLYRMAADGRSSVLTGDELVDQLVAWCDRYPIVSVEDGLAEDDWPSWRRLTAALGDRVQIIGDDLFATNRHRLEHGVTAGAANAVLVKVNQIGSLSETFDVVRDAREAGYRCVISARSGETEDSFIADLAVGTASGQIKVGSVTRSSRLAKWNQLLRICEQLGEDAYAGPAALRA